MMAVELLKWWYINGWGMVGSGLLKKIARATDFFSMELLLKTLFEPFKQISNGTVEGSMEDRFRAFIDRLISRIIGATIRIGLLIIGVLLIILEAILGLAILLIWPLMPFAPIAGIILMVVGI